MYAVEHVLKTAGGMCCAASVVGWVACPLLKARFFLLLQVPYACIIGSVVLCLHMQKKSKLHGWDGFFESLPEPQRTMIKLLSVLQSWPTVWMWLVASKFGMRAYLNEVPLPNILPHPAAPRLYIGGLPLPWHIHTLHSLGVRGIVNMCDEFEGYPSLYTRLDIEQCHLRTIDYCNVPHHQIKSGVDFIRKKIQRKESVYVHCKSGVGRCAMVLVSYLARDHTQFNVVLANEWAQTYRPHIISNVASRPGVKQYFSSLNSG